MVSGVKGLWSIGVDFVCRGEGVFIIKFVITFKYLIHYLYAIYVHNRDLYQHVAVVLLNGDGMVMVQRIPISFSFGVV